VPLNMAGANVARAVGVLPLCPHVVPEYVRYALDQYEKNNELVDLAREVARKTLNLGLLKAAKIPLPPLSEQREIVQCVRALFDLADTIERRVRMGATRAERLNQGTLAKAFRGELVPTEAELARAEVRDYEPASALLPRNRSTQPSESFRKPVVIRMANARDRRRGTP
jgi:type I restriction enzyme, S subunit